MDLYDEKRHLVHTDTVARRNGSGSEWHGWRDVTLGLLDNYCERIEYFPSRNPSNLEM